MTYERMELESLSVNENGLEGLDSQSVERRSSVEHDRMLLDDLVQNCPDFAGFGLYEGLGLLDVAGQVVLDKLLDQKRLEQLESHLGRNTALVHPELRTDDDNRTSAVVDTLSEQVLSETTLLTLEHVRQTLERSAVGALDCSALALGVIQKCIDCFLKHSLLVPDDDVGSMEGNESLESVVSVDDSSVKVIEVAGCKAAAVQLDHRSEIWRDDGDDSEDHPLGTVVAVLEVLYNLDSLQQALVDALGALLLHLLSELDAQGLEIQLREKDPDGLGTHHCIE